MSIFEQLLAVQDHDTRAVQLAHRRAALPQRSELTQVAAELRSLVTTLTSVEAERHTLAREQQRLEDEIDGLRAKAVAVDKAMYDGSVSNVRELQSMTDEIKALQRRVSVLEDTEIEVLERLEPLERAIADAGRQQAAADERAEVLRRALTAAEAEINVEADAVAASRSEAAAGVPDDLLAEYDGLRRRLGGVGVAKLVHGQCGGCHLRLSAVELDRVRHQDETAWVHCEECGRLLAR